VQMPHDAVAQAFAALLEALAAELDRATARRVAAAWQRGAAMPASSGDDSAVLAQLYQQVSQLADAWATATRRADDSLHGALPHDSASGDVVSQPPIASDAMTPDPAAGDAAAVGSGWALVEVTRVSGPGGERLGPIMFRRLILEALVQLGGSATWRAIMAVLTERVEPWLSTADLEPLPYQPNQLRWHYTADWARRVLVARRLIVPGQRRTWQISDAGRRWLTEQQQTPG
jgi:hypothetical protein